MAFDESFSTHKLNISTQGRRNDERECQMLSQTLL